VPIRVLIADDHPIFRFGMRAILSAQSDMELVGEATDGERAIALAEELRPDVILMDLNMPEVRGIEAIRRVLATSPDAGILVLTMAEDDDSVFAAMRAGARGYLLKGADGAETLHAIRAVAGGDAIFGVGIAQRLMGYFSRPAQAAGPDVAFPDLTVRERDILELLAGGYTNGAIAERLCLSPKTVRNYVSTIFDKLQVSDRAQAIVRARKAGMGRGDGA
jgi:DNA-binding NarL/FixJ family response regulator